MRIAPFAVEQWMNAWETRCELNLAETCVHALSVGELLKLTDASDRFQAEVPHLRLTYGAIPGSERLRRAIAALYDRQGTENVLVAHGTIGANHLVYQALVEPGDRVVSVVPTYQQHVSIPEALGAELVQVPLDEATGWMLDLDRLAGAVRPGTRLIALTNPNNPTGALLSHEALQRIVNIARNAGAWLLVDEVYRGTGQTGDGSSPAVADLYDRGISTGGMSKAFALAGLRLGWIVGPRDLLALVERHRDYTTISVGVVDDWLASVALQNADRLLDRARRITRRNASVVDAWVAAEPAISWVRPAAGTTALLRYDLPIGSETFCRRLLEEIGVLLVPGAAFGIEGTVRLGFANPEADLAEGLTRLSRLFEGETAGTATAVGRC